MEKGAVSLRTVGDVVHSARQKKKKSVLPSPSAVWLVEQNYRHKQHKRAPFRLSLKECSLKRITTERHAAAYGYLPSDPRHNRRAMSRDCWSENDPPRYPAGGNQLVSGHLILPPISASQCPYSRETFARRFHTRATIAHFKAYTIQF